MNKNRMLLASPSGRVIAMIAALLLSVFAFAAGTVRAAEPVKISRDDTALDLTATTEIYAERFSDPDGRVRSTFEIIWLSGWAPHESQQKPLRPGSAAQRLADALGTTELPAGEKPERRR